MANVAKAKPLLGGQNKGLRHLSGSQSRHTVLVAGQRAADESVWLQLRELLGHTAGDPGHWNFSPEWWGSQGGGWGRDTGQAVFTRRSSLNGKVEVTAHSASVNGFDSGSLGADGSSLRQEWRVLRFNDETRQSVARVRVVDDADVRQARAQQQRWWLEEGHAQRVTAMPECLAQEYLKSMASLLAALLGLHRLMPDMPESNLRAENGTGGDAANISSGHGANISSGSYSTAQKVRVLCIGLGGGSLPHFLAHHFPYADIDGVEIDPIVVEAATAAMGLPSSLRNLRLHVAGGLEFVARHAEAGGAAYDVVCLDAFTGDDEVPSELLGAEFAAALAWVLHPAWGTLLVNTHGIDIRQMAATFKAALCGKQGGEGNGRGGGGGGGKGSCFSISTQKQQNVTLACSRGLVLPAVPAAAKERLKLAAAYVADVAGYAFPAGTRACRNYAQL